MKTQRYKILNPYWLCALIMILGLIYTASLNAQTTIRVVGDKIIPSDKGSHPVLAKVSAPRILVDPQTYSSLKWRELGPFWGGRSAAVTGVPGKPQLFYCGYTGGGVWRTTDGGHTWKNISDGFFGGSIGAVEVAQSDHNVIYVGGGEKTVRGNVSAGYGMFKSVDAGKTWEHIGLANARHIPRVRVHPEDPDLVYAAVLGDLFKSSTDRGVYRSKDGGQTWEKVLYVNPDAGAVDLIFDPANPRHLYASTWRVRRTPYSLESGGEGSGLWKSTDGGDTWTNLSAHKGLPQGVWGISGIAVSPVNPDRVWVIIESADGGVFRSDDAGKTWHKLNSDRDLRQRAWYYTRIYADTRDEDIVYVLNARYHKSTDGGKTFETFRAPHGDHHDLWIAPEDNQRMVMADDGGAQVTFDGGENWSTYHNQPTAQIYRVTTDDHFPYRIYGSQQDNSPLRIPHRVDQGGITDRDWERTAGEECGHIAVDPTDNDMVYGGGVGGFLARMDHRTHEEQTIHIWPDNPMGHGAEDMKYRFQWNFPLFFSPHDPTKLYAASNHLHVTYDQGTSWEVISPDLTRNDATKLKSSGGPITQDNTSVEYYCTIFAACESPYEKDLLWAGSDDGLLHVSRDGGDTWTDVTPPRMPEWTMINSIDPDPFQPGGAFIAATRYKLGDDTPYLFRTEDYGRSWTTITNGIPANEFTRVVRADPHQQGILYAGTESAIYVSFDHGAHWQSLQLNLPVVPITDLAVKNDNLIAATQGRGFWIIDDLTVLHQARRGVSTEGFHLFRPMDSYRMGGGPASPSLTAGTNHPGGVIVHYLLDAIPNDDELISFTFFEQDGDTICTYSSKAEEDKYRIKLEDLKTGGHTFRWDMQYPGARDFRGSVLWVAALAGPIALPGQYKVQLQIGDQMQERAFNLIEDPRSKATAEDLLAQFEFIKDINRTVTEAHEVIIEIRDLRKQLDDLKKRIDKQDGMQPISDQIRLIDSVMTEVEKALYQTKNESVQDPINFPIRLTNKLAHLNHLCRRGDFRPTEQAYQVKESLTQEIAVQLNRYGALRSTEIPALNALVRANDVDAIHLK